MTARRWATLLLAISAVTAILAVARSSLGPTYSGPPQADRVVVVGVPALDWEVITPNTMPNLWAAAEGGASGLITARAARSVTCPWDGWTTVGAGNRARYPASIPEDELPPEPDVVLPGEPETPVPTPTTTPQTPEEQRQTEATEGCLGQQGTPPTVNGSQLEPAVLENDRLSFGAVPGALGDAVQCTTIVGAAPLLAVATEQAEVTRVGVPTDAPGWADAIGSCPLTLVATEDALDKSVDQLRRLDVVIGELIDGAHQAGATVIVAGISQPEYRRATLHAVVVTGADIGPSILSSPSTSREPFSQVIDIAPTALSILDEDRPSSMVGQVMRTTPRDGPLQDAAAWFERESIGASLHVWMSSRFFSVLSWIGVLAAVLFGFLLLRPGAPLHRGWAALAVAVGMLAPASFLANVIPWWRAERPSYALIGALVGCWVLLTAVAVLGPWRRYRSGPMLAGCLMTTVMLGVDVLTGSNLQLNSPLGYNAIVAGRFLGFGNITYAIFAATALTLVAAACRLVGGDRRLVYLVVGSAGIALVALVGAPGVGTDFGGVVALVPALILLAFIASGTRISRTRLVLAMGAGVVAVLGVAVADYLRPEDQRTHLGRFVGQVLDGTAMTVIERKLQANYRVLTGSVLTLLCVVLIVLCVIAWRSRRSGAREYVARHDPYVRAGAVAVVVMAFVGFAVNDSGIALTAAALVVIVPLVISAISREKPEPDLLS